MSYEPKITISMSEYASLLHACKTTLHSIIVNEIHALPDCEELLMNAIQKTEGAKTMELVILKAKEQLWAAKSQNGLPSVLERCKVSRMSDAAALEKEMKI